MAQYSALTDVSLTDIAGDFPRRLKKRLPPTQLDEKNKRLRQSSANKHLYFVKLNIAILLCALVYIMYKARETLFYCFLILTFSPSLLAVSENHPSARRFLLSLLP